MSQTEKEMKQGAAEAENENLEAEHAEANNGEASAGAEENKAAEKEAESKGNNDAKEDEKDAKAARKDPKDAQIEDLQDRLKRQMAEFDYREDPSGARQLRTRPGSRAGG